MNIWEGESVTFTIVKNALNTPTVQTIVCIPNNISELGGIQQSLPSMRFPVHKLLRCVTCLNHHTICREVDRPHTRTVTSTHCSVLISRCDGENVHQVVLASNCHYIASRAEFYFTYLTFLGIFLLTWSISF